MKKTLMLLGLGTAVVMIGGASTIMAQSADHASMTGHDSAHISVADRASVAKMPTETMPVEAGQGMFGALSEINVLIEERGQDWDGVDMDALWAHLRDMDALMTGTDVAKTELPNGLQMRVSGTGQAKRAMDNMLPAHANFLHSVRPNWKIEVAQIDEDYRLKITSADPKEVRRIQALGFAGFMVQDDHHSSHHFALALGQNVH